MSIIRTQHDKENPYTILNKTSLWDSDLSLEAVGLWARLMSRPDNWKVHTSELCKSCLSGKDRIQRLLRELVGAGFAFRYRPQNESGQFENWETVVFETKKSEEEIKKIFPGCQKPKLGEYKKKANTKASDSEKDEDKIKKMFPERENPALVTEAQEKAATTNIDSTNQISKDIFKDKKEVRAHASTPSLKIKEFVYREENVQTTQEEHERLISHYGEEKTNQAYKYLSEWKAITPRHKWKKGDNLSIRRWVIDALKEKELKQARLQKMERENPTELAHKRKNIGVAREAQSQLRANGRVKWKEFYLNDEELIRLDNGKRISLYLPPIEFESNMIEIFELIKRNENGSL